MGVSTNGQLCFGVLFEEGYEFPWEDDGLEDWWLIESGWTWDGEYPYTEDGKDYAPGFTPDDPRIDAFYTSQSRWKESHPCPVIDVNYQSGEAPAYLIAIPSTLIEAYRGYPEVIDPSRLVVTDEDVQTILDFCDRYSLEFEGEPAWFLSSFWG